MRTRMYAVTMSLALIAVLAVLFALPLSAQNQGNHSSRENAICMFRAAKVSDRPQRKNRGQNVMVLISERAIESFKSKGFTLVSCKRANLANPRARNAFRDRMCKLASIGNQAVQGQLERELGEQPAVLCAQAESISGAWRKPKPRRQQQQ